MNFKDIEFVDDTKIQIGAGVLLSKIANLVSEKSLTGFDFASGIPGTLGGAIRMNAGAYGGEIKDVLVSTTYIDENLEIHTISNQENEFRYRHSRFIKNNKDIIISAVLQFSRGNKEEIRAKMDCNANSRKEKQPINYPNAGSTFKRGEGYITAQLIDQCGLKGYNIGDAYVSEKHAGFIVNKGNATAKEVLKLIDVVEEKVKEKFGINIELEIEVLGED